MTLNELKTEVSALGFEPEADTDPILITAANRALFMIYSELPVISTAKIPVSPREASRHIAKFEHRGGTSRLALGGVAYSFSVSGRGSYTVRDGNGELRRAFDTPLSSFEGRIAGTGEIVFEGEESFTVFDFKEYSVLSSASASDGGYRILSDDFACDILALFEKPRDSEGNVIGGARIDGREIVFPRGFSGLATLRYQRYPRRICNDSALIDIEDGVAYLLPLLTAYFVWLDDDATRAEEYLSLYKRAVGRLACNRSYADSSYRDVTGWA